LSWTKKCKIFFFIFSKYIFFFNNLWNFKFIWNNLFYYLNLINKTKSNSVSLLNIYCTWNYFIRILMLFCKSIYNRYINVCTFYWRIFSRNLFYISYCLNNTFVLYFFICFIGRFNKLFTMVNSYDMIIYLFGI